MSILEISDLHTYFDTKQGFIKAVNGVSLNIKQGKTLGIVGESGCGKSQTAMSVLKLFEKNQSIHGGQIIFDGKVISDNNNEQMRAIRGNEISVIFQEPMTSLNPVFSIGRQIAEVLIVHEKQTKKQAMQNAIKMLNAVKIPNAESMINRYPHELSGGMRQRVMIAIALACKPRLLIADEPTTALDVTIQAQILHLINELQKEQGTSVMFISHDLGVINQIADDVAVMYCGQVVEIAPTSYIFKNITKFAHPYTIGLLNSMPAFTKSDVKRLASIEGNVPHPLMLPKGCKFAPRCKFALEKCHNEQPELQAVSEVQSIRCFYPEIARCDNE